MPMYRTTHISFLREREYPGFLLKWSHRKILLSFLKGADIGNDNTLVIIKEKLFINSN